MKLLFWNIHNTDNSSLIAECIKEHGVDVAVFAEYKNTDFDKLIGLLGDGYDLVDLIGCDKLRLIVSKGVDVYAVRGQSRFFICLIQFDGSEWLLVGAHLQDRWSSEDPSKRLHTIRQIMAALKESQSEYCCKNKIIIGDFNAGPFDRELLQPDAFNAVPFKDVIRKRTSRKWNEAEYEHLYNPVVNWLSEETSTYGSYYTSNPTVNPYWHCFDQVLVSRSLVDWVQDFSYLRSIGQRSLMADVRPDSAISDHLPLLVALEEGDNYGKSR